MSANNETCVIRLNCGEDAPSLFAKASWKKGDLTLTILNGGSKAWQCEIAASDLEEIKSEKKVDKVEEWAKEAFGGLNPDAAKDHVFSLCPKEKTLSWKRARAGTKVKVVLGEFPLLKLDYSDAHDDVMGGALDKIGALERERQRSEIDAQALKEQLDKMTELAEKFKDEKNDLEKSMYEQFLPILQAKQAKNRELEEELRSGGRRGTMEGDTTEEDKEGEDYDDDTDVDETPSKKAKSSESDLDQSQDFLGMKT